MRRTSLSTRLYRRVILLLALFGLGSSLILYAVANREVDRAADAQLVTASRLLYMMMQNDLTAGVLNVPGPASFDREARLLTAEEKTAFGMSYDWCMFAVFWNGRLVARSGWGAPISVLPRKAGLHDFRATGDRWRSFGLEEQGGKLLIVVAERNATVEFSILRALGKLVLPLSLLMAAGMVMLWWTLRASLSEVERLTSTIYDRSLADLTPLTPGDWSPDLEPLITALNTLFLRLGDAYEQEQAFTDDVAHELRTPLAAIRAQAQLLSRGDPANMREELGRLVRGVDRANRLIDGMLTLARLHATTLDSRSVDVHELVAETVAEAAMSLPPEAVEFSVTPDHVVRWRCDAATLGIALSAVIDNALSHARCGGTIDIALVRADERLVVTVADRGPGIPEQDRERLLHRFERGDSASPGSGLGLSIAAKAITLSGGSIRLEDRPDGTGLLVVFTLPALAD
ncbi:two-component system, OmpR family, sensor kinase [Sphingomonas gellani]|uniref:histidine kinase n=1 Tax=Sphingomonas gellani TaxID=1166340 RepID=A0A1H8DB79_9SPHN|nr:HAMP domain-containing sensor histidine kinase [Sphingomonas gellani]SEN03737.1 two-component system, OmpR family, sensor kinase [Sphingomonas gellani]